MTTITSPLPPTINELRQRLLPVCLKHGILGVEVFGSVARGEAKAGSDVDLIIELDPRKKTTSAFDLCEIQEDLSDAAGVTVQIMTTDDYQRIGNPFLLISMDKDRFTLLRT